LQIFTFFLEKKSIFPQLFVCLIESSKKKCFITSSLWKEGETLVETPQKRTFFTIFESWQIRCARDFKKNL